MKTGSIFHLVLITLVSLLPEISQAQSIEEVIVTAQKRAESVQEVPISITAISGDSLRELGVMNSGQLADVVPNLEWLDDGTNVPQIFMRGIGDISFHLNQQGGIGMYMDEVSLNSPVLRGLPLYDLERVEVLRGPQNTLFGLNTTGGSIQLISHKPSVDEGLNGFMNLTYNSLEAWTAEGAVGFAASDTVAIRLAATGTKQADWKDNITLHREVGGYDQFAGRAQVLWKASSTVDVLLNVHDGRKRGDRYPDLTYGSRNPANPRLVDPGCAFEIGNGCADSTGFVMPTDWDTVAYNINGQDDVDTAGAYLSIKWRLPSVDVTSITAFEHAESLTNGDSDGGPLNILTFGQESDTDQWSQEIRLTSTTTGRFRWLTGLYYFFEEADWATYLRFTPPPVFLAGGGPRNAGPQNVPNNVTSQNDEIWSVYGQAEYDLANLFTLTFGLRYTNENKDADVATTLGVWTDALFPADRPMGFDELRMVNANSVSATANPDKTWEEFGGKVSLDYRITDDALLYALISRGFKGGGTSLAAIEGLTGNPGRVIDPETLWSYEVGAKTSWLDNSLQLNAALFYNDWKDQQLFTNVVSEVISGSLLINVPQSRSYGAELEMKWTPGDGWLLSGGLTLLHAELTKTGPKFPDLTEGDTLPNSPKLTFNGQVRKDWELANGVFSLQSTFNYKGDVHYDIRESPILREGDYWILNARGSYRFGADQEYEIAIFGENLTGTEYCRQRTDNVASSPFSGTGRCTGNPGEAIFGVTGSLRF